jgi:hypothetical protein
MTTCTPALFRTPMVRAILEGRGRGLKSYLYSWAETGPVNEMFARENCPYGEPGGLLWVRETCGYTVCSRGQNVLVYQADNSARFVLATDGGEGDLCGVGDKADKSRCEPVDRWRPSIYMPRWACRLVLRVTSVRVERLQEISEADAIAEGVDVLPGCETPGMAFEQLWESINGKDSWAANPWVRAITFEVAAKTHADAQALLTQEVEPPNDHHD